MSSTLADIRRELGLDVSDLLLEDGDAFVGGGTRAHRRLQMVLMLLAIFSSERPPT
jgi:hypothetical protein